MAVENEKIVRSRTVSFRDIHIAKVTTNTETEYATEKPSKLARAITGKISDEFETEKIYSDDSVEDVTSIISMNCCLVYNARFASVSIMLSRTSR